MARRGDHLGDDRIGQIERPWCALGEDESAPSTAPCGVVNEREEFGDGFAIDGDTHGSDQTFIDEEDEKSITRRHETRGEIGDVTRIDQRIDTSAQR